MGRLNTVHGIFGEVDVQADGCWLWPGRLDRDGYGRVRYGGSKSEKAHRFAYEVLVGPIPEGLVIDHLCRVRNCVNPAHMEPVVSEENVSRGAWGLRTACSEGHPYTPENTRRARDGARVCRHCARVRQYEWAHRTKPFTEGGVS